MNEAIEIMFDLWMKQNHSKFYIITGIIYILLIAVFVFSIICIWIFPLIWWKISLTDIGIFLVFRWYCQIQISIFIDKFGSGKDKIKM